MWDVIPKVDGFALPILHAISTNSAPETGPCKVVCKPYARTALSLVHGNNTAEVPVWVLKVWELPTCVFNSITFGLG